MNLKKKFVIGAASLALVAGMGVAPAMAAPADISANRWAGSDRYDTAIQVALKGWADANGENPSAATVYVSNGASLVDAIAGGVLKNGPMLLVNGDKAVQSKVADAIKKLNAGKVIALGGTGAVSDEALKAVAGTATTERIAGADRFETAAKIAEAAKKQGVSVNRVYLANGQTLVDALVGGQLKDGVILLTDGADKLPAATAKALNKIGGGASLYALGGTGAVSDAVLKSAAVSQTILIDSFLEDNKAAVEASAKADLAVNGWVKVNGATQDQFTDALSATPTTKAKIAATWPKVDAALAANPNVNGKSWYLKNDANGQATKETYANAIADASPTEKLESGAEATAYLGTTKAVAAAQEVADDAKTDVTAGTLKGKLVAATGIINASADALLDEVINDGTNGKKGLGSVPILTDVQNVFPDVTAKTTGMEFVTSIGLDPANLKTDIAGQTKVLDSALKAQVAKLQADAAAAGKANTAAIKAKTKASEALDKLIHGGAVNYNVNRLGGADRFETAVKIANHVYGEKGEKSDPTRIYFANGMSFADAAVAGYIDNSKRPGPVLLVNKDSVPSVTGEQALAWDKAVDYVRKNVTFIGGTGVISDENGAAELEKLAPATAASGKVSFGTWDTSATKVAEIAVTTKDMPNGSTLSIEWYGRTGNAGTGDLLAATSTLGGATVQSATTTVDQDGKVKIIFAAVPSPTSYVRVKVTAKNSSGEVITETYSTWTEVK
ncbi:putative cell wall binding repeat 2 [Mobiluncus holmesii ATCC 35242]|uniref:Putative cell wall binding repeat 2 n=2 Tax=Mobiluncus holmesii TaxID=144178 RepID=E6M5N5_9ACTO|nr:cell wall-binding repeat-containing protein [Mobiluncus holmesii]EFU81327.1 putative cell wall binding repeat 2 [Mobiluncus holmesii ATCC 35242]STY88204.1 N-acetylmuramoyl-L-alanine amidase LytC precursor [Mobiluncus holmesii]STY90014.1 N-acetylmuramoyl-L-alanine amidase LytC precursor [Mobiluncus holmesii]